MKKITLLFTMLAFSFGFAQNGGDTCGAAVAATAGTTFTGTTITQASAGSEMGTGGDSAWFVYSATADGTLTIDSCDGGADTYLSVGTGTCGALVVSAQNDDACPSGLGNNFASVLSIAVTTGTDYYIEWDDRYTTGANAFDWSLNFIGCTAPTVGTLVIVDDCANNEFSITVPITDLGNSASLTISNDVGVAATTVTATGDATAGPFPTGTPVNLTIEHETDADCNLVGGPFADGCPPPNDACATPVAVTSGNTYDYNTAGASLDEPTTCGTASEANNVWFSYDSSVNGPETVTLSTCNDGGATPGSAAYDSKIFVYSGACGALVCEANNDDGAGCAGFSSLLEFVTDGTSTYLIAMSGYTTATGVGVLSVDSTPAVTPPANNDCASAATLAVDGVDVAGDNTNATNAIANPSCDTFGTISDVWYTFNGPATGEVTLTTTVGSATDAWFAVYDACGGTELGCASGATVGGGTGSDGQPGGKQLELTGLTPGAAYLVQVWNDGAAVVRAEGTFTIKAEEGLLSVGTNVFEGFKYFPNPVNGALSLRAQNNIQNVAIYNMLGQEVVRTAPNTLSSEVDMSNLQTGAYFVKVTINDATETVRIIKE